jgi:hypothetical protein
MRLHVLTVLTVLLNPLVSRQAFFSCRHDYGVCGCSDKAQYAWA